MNEITTWLLALITPAEWSGLLWLLVATLTATHTVKVTWRLIPAIPGTGTAGQLSAVSAVLSLGISYFIWPGASTVPWWLAGVIGGPLSNYAFKIINAVLKKFAPDIAAFVNADKGG